MNVIEVANVSKMFRLGAHTGDLRDRFNALFAREKAAADRKAQEFWALRDISFSVAEGESFGIIGHNGSGKSTLLKLITGIYKPTTGTFRTRGRIAALIEVGAGFHPDLTGRENVYLNGSVLGMSRRDIGKKFDEIVAFAEMEKFMDTPVKRYSSGMYMRLGFAIAANIDPDVVLVDEVLAVGDEAFQRKCMNKMLEMRAQGKTIVYISHAMASVTELCQRVMLLDQGNILAIGKADETILAYRDDLAERVRRREIMIKASHNGWTVEEQEARDAEEAEEREREAAEREREAREAEQIARTAGKPVKILAARLLDTHGKECETVSMYDTVRLECTYRADLTVENPVFGVALYRDEGDVVLCAVSTHYEGIDTGVADGENTFEVSFEAMALLPGHYFFGVSFSRCGEAEFPIDYYHRIVSMTVIGDAPERGIVPLSHTWYVPGEGTTPRGHAANRVNGNVKEQASQLADYSMLSVTS